MLIALSEAAKSAMGLLNACRISIYWNVKWKVCAFLNWLLFSKMDRIDSVFFLFRLFYENVCLYVFMCECKAMNYAYLECGINNGEPIDGGGIVGVGKSAALLTAAVSGCKKFRRWSTRSWCCVKHREISSGSASNRS